MAAPSAPRVWSGPAGVPFLPALADALLAGRLVSLPEGDPLALASVTVLLPNRRATRAFADVLAARLADRTGADAAILPVLRPIGDIDEDELILDPFAGGDDDGLTLPPAIAPLARRLALARLTLAWAEPNLRRHPLGLREGEPLLIPASASDAVRLAGDLARLIDDMEVAGVGWENLATLVPEDHADHYRLTLDFLEIVSRFWPAYLKERNLADPLARRSAAIRAVAARLTAHGSPGPIIAAGSTGSIPATAELLKAIARLPNGAVVLPGLDRNLDEPAWRAIGDGEPNNPAAACAHPQFALQRLVATIGIARDDVVDLVAPSAAAVARGRMLAAAMLPAAALDWSSAPVDPAALAGVSLLVARNEQTEATAIALAMREAVETPGATAALVTPDRTLARRVAVELRRWQLTVDDSAPLRLAEAPHGVFARLLIEAALSDADPVKLLALAKHPLAAFGMPRAECRRAARTLELAVLRGHRRAGGLPGLVTALVEARNPPDDKKRRGHRPSAADGARASRLLDALAECLSPLAKLAEAPRASLSAAVALLIDALARAGHDGSRGDGALWSGAGGSALASLLEELATDREAASLTLPPADLPYFLETLFADTPVPRRPDSDPRLHIWGPLEARLQSVDLLVLGGLDEGVWPPETRTDPWLSRAMRAALGLAPPEARIGRAAHDFVAAMSAPRVIVTRAARRAGSPTVASRWLQRLAALIGKDAADALTARGAGYVAMAGALDAAPAPPVPVERPQPQPPLAARPKKLSVTEIETLVRDPYAIYAKHVLKLRPLDPLGRPPDAALRGTLMHEALGTFIAGWRGLFDATAEAALAAIAAESLRDIEAFPDVHAVWSARLAHIGHWLIAFEAARDGEVAERHAEIDGNLVVVPDVFTLSGRADRIDEMKDGTLAIYDFKTGTPQSDRSVFAQLTPQMSLEAAMARAGAFAPIPAGRSVSELAWLAVGKAGRDEPYISAVIRNQTPDGVADAARAMLAALATEFASPDHGYASRTRPRMDNDRYIGDYDHLARVREWALVESAEDVGFMGGPQP